MKKKLLSTLLLLAAFAATADVAVDMKTTGVDKYNNGDTVLDHEFYALVWTAGSEFSGFNADATLVNPADKLLTAVPYAENGKLPRTSHQILEKDVPGLSKGSLHIVLLDTRNADGTLADAAAGESRTLKVVNGYRSVFSKTFSAMIADSLLKITDFLQIDMASIIPAGTPQPVITGVTLREGASGREMVIRFKVTAAFLRYTAGGVQLGSAQIVPAEGATSVNGADSESQEIEVVVPATDDEGLYKIIRQRAVGEQK